MEWVKMQPVALTFLFEKTMSGCWPVVTWNTVARVFLHICAEIPHRPLCSHGEVDKKVWEKWRYQSLLLSWLTQQHSFDQAVSYVIDCNRWEGDNTNEDDTGAVTDAAVCNVDNKEGHGLEIQESSLRLGTGFMKNVLSLVIFAVCFAHV